MCLCDKRKINNKVYAGLISLIAAAQDNLCLVSYLKRSPTHPHPLTFYPWSSYFHGKSPSLHDCITTSKVRKLILFNICKFITAVISLGNTVSCKKLLIHVL